MRKSASCTIFVFSPGKRVCLQKLNSLKENVLGVEFEEGAWVMYCVAYYGEGPEMECYIDNH